MRRGSGLWLTFLGLAVGSVIGLAATASSAPAAGSSRARQTALYSLHSDLLTGSGWHYINLPTPPGPPSAGFNVPSVGRTTFEVSAVLRGAPVEIRLLDNGRIRRPSPVAFDPRRTDNAFSFTFVNITPARTCGHTFRLQWHSPTGRKVLLQHGSVVITYVPTPGVATACT